MTIRPYQEAVIRSVVQGWDDRSDGPTKQLVVVPTGGGKTIIFAKLAQIKHGAAQRTLVLAHREELIEQAIAKIAAVTGIRAEVEKSDRHASNRAPIVIASVQTLMRQSRLESWAPNHFSLVVCDEAHHAISPSWASVLNRFDQHADVVGVTATPDRGDKRALASYFTRLACEVRLVDLIRDGYLAPITLRAVPIQIDIRAVRSIAGDYDATQLDDALGPYLSTIAKALREYAPGRRILAFLPLIATSQKFAAACRAEGLTAEHVDGNSPDRAEILERFASCEIDVLTNAMLLTEGFDDPGIDCVLVLRPTRSRPLYAQMIGRGTRTHPLKDNLLILDFLWLHDRHSLAHPASLVARDDAEAEAMTHEVGEAGGEQLDLLEVQGSAQKQREEALRQKLIEHKDKTSKFVSADEWAAQHDRIAIAEYEPTFAWEEKPISEAQARVLKRAGIDTGTVRGRGHASQIIDVVLGEVSRKACSPAQRHLLRRMGHESPDTATVGEFRQFMARAKAVAA